MTLLEPVGTFAPLAPVGRVKAPAGRGRDRRRDRRGHGVPGGQHGTGRGPGRPAARRPRPALRRPRRAGHGRSRSPWPGARSPRSATAASRSTGSRGPSWPRDAPIDPGRGGCSESRSRSPHPEALAGRTLLIRHGDGTSRGWTIVEAENLEEGGARIHVREDAGPPHRTRVGHGPVRAIPRRHLPWSAQIRHLAGSLADRNVAAHPACQPHERVRSPSPRRPSSSGRGRGRAGLVGQDEQLLPDAREERRGAAAREVGAADRAGEDHVAHRGRPGAIRRRR